MGEVTLKNPDLTLSSLAYWDAKMQIRRRVDSELALIELSTANGRIEYDIGTAKIKLSLSADETEGLELGGHVYDLELYSSGSKPAVVRLIKGTFSVE